MTIRERMALTIEAQTWPRGRIGLKDAAIHEQLGMTPVRHAQVVGALLERADAMVEMPVEVARLRRLVALRRSSRRGRTSGLVDQSTHLAT